MDVLIRDQSLVFPLLCNFIGYDQTSIVIMVRVVRRQIWGFLVLLKTEIIGYLST